QLLFYALAAVLVWGWPARPLLASVAAALIIALAGNFKPHAVALVPAVAGLFLASPALRFQRRVGWGTALGSAALLVAAWYGFLALLWRLSHSAFEFNLLNLVGRFYAGYLAAGTSAGFWLDNLWGIATYAATNALGLALLFPIALICLLLRLWRARRWRSGGEVAETSDRSITFCVLLTTASLCLLAMVANFSQS